MFRILTEDKNREAIYDILNSYMDGYTVAETTGWWKGTKERSLAIDMLGPTRVEALRIAAQIKEANNQEAVLILELPVIADFV